MWKGEVLFSRTTTRQPWRARSVAVVEPAGPPPTTRTSQSGGGEAAGFLSDMARTLLGTSGLGPGPRICGQAPCGQYGDMRCTLSGRGV